MKHRFKHLIYGIGFALACSCLFFGNVANINSKVGINPKETLSNVSTNQEYSFIIDKSIIDSSSNGYEFALTGNDKIKMSLKDLGPQDPSATYFSMQSRGEIILDWCDGYYIKSIVADYTCESEDYLRATTSTLGGSFNYKLDNKVENDFQNDLKQGIQYDGVTFSYMTSHYTAKVNSIKVTYSNNAKRIILPTYNRDSSNFVTGYNVDLLVKYRHFKDAVPIDATISCLDQARLLSRSGQPIFDYKNKTITINCYVGACGKTKLFFEVTADDGEKVSLKEEVYVETTYLGIHLIIDEEYEIGSTYTVFSKLEGLNPDLKIDYYWQIYRGKELIKYVNDSDDKFVFEAFKLGKVSIDLFCTINDYSYHSGSYDFNIVPKRESMKIDDIKSNIDTYLNKEVKTTGVVIHKDESNIVLVDKESGRGLKAQFKNKDRFASIKLYQEVSLYGTLTTGNYDGYSITKAHRCFVINDRVIPNASIKQISEVATNDPNKAKVQAYDFYLIKDISFVDPNNLILGNGKDSIVIYRDMFIFQVDPKLIAKCNEIKNALSRDPNNKIGVMGICEYNVYNQEQMFSLSPCKEFITCSSNMSDFLDSLSFDEAPINGWCHTKFYLSRDLFLQCSETERIEFLNKNINSNNPWMERYTTWARVLGEDVNSNQKAANNYLFFNTSDTVIIVVSSVLCVSIITCFFIITKRKKAFHR